MYTIIAIGLIALLALCLIILLQSAGKIRRSIAAFEITASSGNKPNAAAKQRIRRCQAKLPGCPC